jgi:hypothetical protein
MSPVIAEIGFLTFVESRRAELEYAMEFIASAIGARLCLRRPGESLAGLERLVVAGPAPADLPLPDSLRVVLFVPSRLDDLNGARLQDWVEPGPLPVFGERRAFAGGADLPWRYRSGGAPVDWAARSGTTLLQLGFDALGPVWRSLAREEELRPETRAAFVAGRAAGSWVEGHGLVELPWIDRCAQFFEALLDLKGESRLLPRWPGGARWAVALSHDVDMLFKWRLRSALRLLLTTPALALSGRWRRLARLWRELLARLRGGEDPWFLVDELMDLEARLGLHSTLLFLAESHDHQTYRYRIARPVVQALLRRVLDNGFELGLHAGWHTLGDRDRLLDEKRRLEAITSRPVSLVRQHWLRFDRELSWSDQELAEFRVDGSLGWNDRPGFRAGTSLPFHPWCFKDRRPRRLLTVPLALMDSQLYDEQGLDGTRARAASEALIERLRRARGLLGLNWHPHVLCEADFPGRRGHYLDLLEQAAAEGAALLSLGAVAEHWLRRESLRRGSRPEGARPLEEGGR